MLAAPTQHERRLLLLLLPLTACALAAAPDALYEETFSTRRPFAGAWPPARLPTGWLPLPCAPPIASAVTSPALGALLLCGPGSAAPLFSASLDAAVSTTGAALPPSSALTGAVLAALGDAVFLLVPGSTTLFSLDCSVVPSSNCNATAIALPAPLPSPAVSASAVYASATRTGSLTIWATGDGAIDAYDVNVARLQAQPLPGLPFAFGASAVAHSDLLGEVTLANASKVVFLSASAPSTALYWEWASDVSSGAGGVYDDAITALLNDDSDGGLLYVGTPCCLNVRAPTGVVTRVAGHEGLPWGNITSLALQAVGHTRLWLGTSRGAVLYDPLAPSQYGYGRAAASAAGPPLQQRFRYFYGPRWLAASSEVDAFSDSAVGGIVCDGAKAFILATGGLSVLESRNVTLQDKVVHYEAALPRHSRLAQVSQCDLVSFGVVEGCVSGPDDNDGLWTSLSVIAESMRLLLTGADAARALVSEHFAGMHLLMRATGIRGLISRSVVCPGCDTGGGGVWHNSTVPGLEGYQWKGDASSDEVVGHSLAYPFVVRALAGAAPDNASVAREALLDLSRYIVESGFVLIDVTGEPTTWGHFEPSVLNVNRSNWSDSRGLNSVTMLGLIAGGLTLTDAADPDHAVFAQALTTLRDAGYFRNAVNLKIESPSDDNFSDDELTMFAYFSFVFSARGVKEIIADDWRLVNLSLARTFAVLQSERSAVWDTLFAAMGIVLDDEAVADVIWNLRTWQFELTAWPTRNSHRLDVILDVTNAGRSGGFNDGLAVLPANERSQGRWNADPYDLDGGDGNSEDDPGAFLLAYWAARYAGILDTP